MAEPKLARWLVWVPVVLGWVVILVLWIGVVWWPVCHGALLILTLVALGMFVCKKVLRIIARQDQ